MWKCIRCEKENQDLAEQCENCGHGRTMDYTGHRVVSKLETEMIGAWKYDQNDPEYIRKQAVEHLQKAVELLVKSGLSGSAEKTKKVITEVKKASGLNKNFNIQMVENDHQTEQNISPFRYGGQNVLGQKESDTDRKKTQSRKRKISSKISKKELRVLNQSDLDNYKDKRNYTGKTIEEMMNHSFFSVFPNADKKWLVAYTDVAVNGSSRYIRDYSPEINKEIFVRCFQPLEGFCACLLTPVDDLNKALPAMHLPIC